MGSVDYSSLFTKMSNNMDLFINEVKNKNPKLMATDKWSVKDELCHLTFWHTYYAQNYKAISLHKVPPLLEGPGYELNDIGVKSLRKFSIKKLITKLRSANDSLYESIVVNKIPKMTYKKNGRVYKTEDFLHLIERHFNTHRIQVRRAK